jgi:protein tyrosine/serine phosphatase
VPLKFAQVEHGIFRSAYPANKTFAFLQTLSLRSMVCLEPKDIHDDLRQFCHKNGIILVEADVGVNKEPFLTMNRGLIQEIMNFTSKPYHRPCLIFCTKGNFRTSCVVGCLRKTSQWSMNSIIREYELFIGEGANMLDVQVIDSFRHQTEI